MKLRLFTFLMLIGLLFASSGPALAQGWNPPAALDSNLTTLPKSSFFMPTGRSVQDQAFHSINVATLISSSITNGDFEQGSIGWAQYSSHGYPLIINNSSLAHRGAWGVWLAGDDNEESILSQSGITITDPASILHLVYWIYSEDDCASDYGYVKINSDVVHTWNLCSATTTTDWTGLDIDLGAYNGQTVTLSISAITDSSIYSNLFIDDVSLAGIFSDVPTSHTYFNDIEILYANGLTAGCATAPLSFCPDQIMNRAQSAVFMLRGEFGVGYAPPSVLNHIFADDWAPGAWAEKWAEGMYNANLTAGCTTSGALKFCPWGLTPREQAAVFGLKLKYGNSYIPPAATGTVFADMTNPSYYATKWAEQAYADGLLPNCGIDSVSSKPLFCPNVMTTRGLAAYIIVRAKNLSMP